MLGASANGLFKTLSYRMDSAEQRRIELEVETGSGESPAWVGIPSPGQSVARFRILST